MEFNLLISVKTILANYVKDCWNVNDPELAHPAPQLCLKNEVDICIET